MRDARYREASELLRLACVLGSGLDPTAMILVGASMPTLYRIMTPDTSGTQPALGQTNRQLGVRPGLDIKADGFGMVGHALKGMSVVPAWRKLVPHLIPKRLQPKVPGACGGYDEDRCFRMGTGPFLTGVVSPGLKLFVDKPERHGVVMPLTPVAFADYEDALAQTQPLWVIDEE